MKKRRILFATVTALSLTMFSCDENVSELNVQKIEDVAADGDGNTGGGGDNPPPIPLTEVRS